MKNQFPTTKEKNNYFNKNIDKILSIVEKSKNYSIPKRLKFLADMKKICTDKYNEYELQDYMKGKKEYGMMNKWFNEIYEYLRKKAEKSKYYKQNINTVLKNVGVPKKDWSKYFKKMSNAYQYTLNKYKGKWAGYWSLISYNLKGKITGVWLGDTADCEYFWEYIDKHHKDIKNLALSTLT